MAKHGRHSALNDQAGYRSPRVNEGEFDDTSQPRRAPYQKAPEYEQAPARVYNQRYRRPALDSESVPAVRPVPVDSAYASSSESRFYGRDNYGSHATGPHARTASTRASLGKRIAIIAGFVVLGVVLALLAYVLWFSTALNNTLAPSAETLEAVDQQLVSTPIDQPFYMLILGSDSREGSGTSTNPTMSGDQERSDVIMLARIDMPNKQVTLVSVPRDTPYTLPDGSVVKINEAYNIDGAAGSIKAVSELTGAPIAHYVAIHISELESIVDSLGGIDVYVDRQLTVKDTLTGEKVTIPAGQQTLNGQQAQVFVRARHQYSEPGESPDGSRQSNVRTFTQAVIRKVLDRPVVELPGVILDLAQYVETDLKASDLVSLGVGFSGGGVKIYNCTGPIDGYTAEEYGGIWLCYPNPEGWAELMRQVDAGLEPGEIDYASTQIVPEGV